MPLKVGDKAPVFSLPASTGKTISLQELAGKKVVLQQFPLIPLLPLFSSTQNTLWAVDISIEVKSSLNHAQNGFDMRSGIRLVRALNARSLSRT